MEQEENNKNDLFRRIITAMTFVLSLGAMILAVIVLVRLNDLEERLKSVSLNSYVEQTVVSNNYIVSNGDESGQVTVSFSDDDQKTAYLTFDDGPSENTEKILQILKDYNVKATFFVCGTADGNESLRKMYKKIVDEGHTIAMHSYSHKYSTLYASKESFEYDLDKIHSLIYNETGVDTRIYRFPGGSGNTVSKHDMGDFINIVHDRGYEYWDWNVYPGNEEGTSIPADIIVSGILDKVDRNDSSIILLHDTGAKDSTVEALPKVIEGLREKEIKLLPMSTSTPLIQQRH